MSESFLIVGLGNPGKDYQYTRHNLGFLVVEHLARQNALKFSQSSFTNALTAEGQVAGKKLMLLLPLTYVNNSGAAVRAAVHYKKIALENILVVMDDVNVEFKEMRLRPSGSNGGHNGLSSVIEHMKTKDFGRLRLGVGAPRQKDMMVDYVLGEFTAQEKKHLKGFIEEAGDCCIAWLSEGMNKAMNQFNRRKNDE